MTTQATLQEKVRVLFVEDDPTLETSIVAALPAQSYEVLLATDWRKALEPCSTEDIDILILDTDTESKDPLQLLADLRAGKRHCRTLVITSSFDQLALASGAGVDGVLMKPVDLTTMVTALNNLLARFRTAAVTETWREGRTAPAFQTLTSHRHWGINE